MAPVKKDPGRRGTEPIERRQDRYPLAYTKSIVPEGFACSYLGIDHLFSSVGEAGHRARNR